MKNSTLNRLVKAFSSPIQSIFNGTLYEWASENVVLPQVYAINGPFNYEISPYLKKPMADLTDNSVRQVNLACSTQTGKSLIQEILMPYIILNDPAPTLRVHQSQPAANDTMVTRILPLLRNNREIKLITNLVKFNAKSGLFNLPNMFIKSVGTSENNLHGLTVKYVVADEVWLYEDPNVIDKVRARTTAFEKNYKLVLSSQPDIEGSQLHKEYVKGNIYHYGWRCPACNILQPYEFQGSKDGKNYGLVWTPQNDEGTLTYDQRTNDCRMVCQHCFHEVKDTEENRIKMVQQGDYIQIQSGDPTINSYSWPAYVNKDKTYKKVAMQYCQAKQVFKKTGMDNDLKLFRNQVLGIFWKKGELIDTPKLLADFTLGTEAWENETHRFMTIDVQANCMYWLVTAWSNKVSEARLVDWGVCVGFDELINIKKKFGIKPTHIAIDSGTDTVALYKETIMRGEWVDWKGSKIWAKWLCLKGDGGKSKITPKIDYTHADGSKKYYGVESAPDPQWAAGSKFSGFRARLSLWSNYSIKTLLHSMINNKLPFKFRFNERADETFTKHMNSEYLNPKSGRWEEKSESIPNHLWDCMAMTLVLALMGKCYVPEASIQEEIMTKADPSLKEGNPTQRSTLNGLAS